MSLSGHEPLKVLLWAKCAPSWFPSTLTAMVSRGACEFSWVWTTYLRTIIHELSFVLLFFFFQSVKQRIWGNVSGVKGKEAVGSCTCYRTFYEQAGIWGEPCGQNGVSAEGQPRATNHRRWLARHVRKDRQMSPWLTSLLWNPERPAKILKDLERETEGFPGSALWKLLASLKAGLACNEGSCFQ